MIYLFRKKKICKLWSIYTNNRYNNSRSIKLLNLRPINNKNINQIVIVKLVVYNMNGIDYVKKCANSNKNKKYINFNKNNTLAHLS